MKRRSFFYTALLLVFFFLVIYTIYLHSTGGIFSANEGFENQDEENDANQETENPPKNIQPPTDVPEAPEVKTHPASETQSALDEEKYITFVLPKDVISNYYPANININVYHHPARGFQTPNQGCHLQAPVPNDCHYWVPHQQYMKANPTCMTQGDDVGFHASSSLGYAPVFNPVIQ